MTETAGQIDVTGDGVRLAACGGPPVSGAPISFWFRFHHPLFCPTATLDNGRGVVKGSLGKNLRSGNGWTAVADADNRMMMGHEKRRSQTWLGPDVGKGQRRASIGVGSGGWWPKSVPTVRRGPSLAFGSGGQAVFRRF